MRNTPYAVRLTFLLAVAGIIAACGTTSTSVKKKLHDRDYKGTRFNNVLVIALGRDYDKRAQFERDVAAGIRHTGTDARAFYTIVSGNDAVSAETITATVQQNGFDSVLFTRVKDSSESLNVKGGSAGSKSTVRGGSLIDLFRYDYEELDEPDNVSLAAKVVLLTEFFSVADEKKIWAIESSTSSRDSIGRIIDSESAAIVNRLRRDKLIGSK